MLEFHPLQLEDLPRLRSFFNYSGSRICDTTPGTVFIWRDLYETEWAICDDSLYFKVQYPSLGETFTLPLGATINMGGTAIYQGVCSLFIASCFGVTLTMPQMLTIIFTATLASVGTAGVPSAGMIMLAMVLQSVGLPVEGIALVAGVDRIFDMGRTTINITGDAACAIIVSRMEDRREARKAAKENGAV